MIDTEENTSFLQGDPKMIAHDPFTRKHALEEAAEIFVRKNKNNGAPAKDAEKVGSKILNTPHRREAEGIIATTQDLLGLKIPSK